MTARRRNRQGDVQDGRGRRTDTGYKKKRSVFGDILSGFLMIVALSVFLYSGYTLYGYYNEYKKSADEYDNLEDNFVIQNAEPEDYDRLEVQTDESETPETEEMMTVEENGEMKTVPVMVNPVDFTELKNVNEDVIGWLKIRALDISYPLVQGEDNDFYLHRTFEKKDNFAGCIFMNSENEPDFTDMNTIIYGHNMKDGSMFGKLKKFGEDEIWKKSEYFWIFTPDLIYQYHIFSVRTVNKTGPTYQTFFTDEEFHSMLNDAFAQSIVDNSDITVDTDDRIVTLSTCTGNDATRLVVVGKLEQVYAAKQ